MISPVNLVLEIMIIAMNLDDEWNNGAAWGEHFGEYQCARRTLEYIRNNMSLQDIILYLSDIVNKGNGNS